MKPAVRHRDLRVEALAAVALAAAGCFLPREDSDACTESATSRTLAPGELWPGHDAAAALAPFAGHWRGTLTWLTGDVTGFELDLPADPPSPLKVYIQCGDQELYVSTNRPGTIATDDGAVNHAGPHYFKVAFKSDGSPELPTYPLPMSPLRGTLGPPPSDVIDVSRYSLFYLDLSLTWNTDDAEPIVGSLRFKGTSASSGQPHDIELGTVAF